MFQSRHVVSMDVVLIPYAIKVVQVDVTGPFIPRTRRKLWFFCFRTTPLSHGAREWCDGSSWKEHGVGEGDGAGEGLNVGALQPLRIRFVPLLVCLRLEDGAC